MSNIDTAFVQQFSDNLILLSQQEGSRLKPLVANKQVRGKFANFDRIGPTKAQKKVSRHSDTPIIDIDYSRRRVQMEDYEWADLIDEQDEVRMLVDPQSSYAISGAYALGRSMDDVILEAATGNATSVTSAAGAGSGSNVPLPSGQKVDEDFDTTDSNLIIAKLIEAKRILLANDVDIKSEDLFMAINASAHSSLLGENQIQSRDFNTQPALVNGMIDMYMGFKFIHTQRLLGTANGTDSDPVKCVAFARSGIGFAIGQDMDVRITERDDKSYATQVYANATFGATRVEDEKVVEVQCVQS